MNSFIDNIKYFIKLKIFNMLFEIIIVIIFILRTYIFVLDYKNINPHVKFNKKEEDCLGAYCFY